MSEKIVTLNEKVIKGQIKELVRMRALSPYSVEILREMC